MALNVIDFKDRNELGSVVTTASVYGPAEVARLAGIKDELALRGMRLAPERTIYAGGSALRDARNALSTALEHFPSATAVICTNDLLAAGALMECSARGLSVPQDISVTGYGDLEIAAAMNPSITTCEPEPRTWGDRRRMSARQIRRPEYSGSRRTCHRTHRSRKHRLNKIILNSQETADECFPSSETQRATLSR